MIYTKSKEILSNQEKYNSIVQSFGSIKETLGESGASKKAAQIIFDIMNDTEKN
jgi:lipid A disaccharide synthetase